MPKNKQPKVKQKMLGAYALIYKALSQSKADKLMQTIEQLLSKRHRASSAIEGFNALLRPYLYVRKGVSQGFLNYSKLGTIYALVELVGINVRHLMKH
jgi:hypothetical protein